MSALGDLLELLYTATSRYTTLRATIRDWSHTERTRRAGERHAARTGSGWTSFGPPVEPPDSYEAFSRIWLAPPQKLRLERQHPGEPAWSEVDDGERRFSWAEGHPVTVSESQPGSAYWGFEHLFDPALLLGRLVLGREGETVWAGRRALRVATVDRHSEWHLPPHLPEGADGRELLVDAERGIVLRLASLIDGEEFSISELVDIGFDEAFPKSTFTPQVPAGTRIVDLRDEEPAPTQFVTIEEAQRVAPFTVLVPKRVPAGARLEVHFAPGDERFGAAPSVALLYEVADGAHSLTITQSGDSRQIDFEGERLDYDGQELRFWETHGRRQFGLERSGTYAFVDSDLDRETLIEIALSLEPAPTEPPRLVDG